MSKDWEKVSAAEFFSDVERANREAYKLHPHSWGQKKRIPWVVCKSCGLIGLRNSLTRWCEKMGCNFDRHPDYRRQAQSARAR